MKIWTLAFTTDRGAILPEISISVHSSKESAEGAVIEEMRGYIDDFQLSAMPDDAGVNVEAWHAHVVAEMKKEGHECDATWLIEQKEVLDLYPAALEVM